LRKPSIDIKTEDTVFLPVNQPLDLRATIDSGQVFRWRWDGDWCYGVIGEHAYSMRQADGGLLVRSSATSQMDTSGPVADFLRLDDDIEGMFRDLANDTPLTNAVKRWQGLRILRQDPWECLVGFVCSQVSNIPRISRNMASVAEAYGERVELDGRFLHRFPGAERLAAAGEDGLFVLGLGFRAGYLAKIADNVANGDVGLAALRLAPYGEAKAVLTQMKGIGDKVADCVLLFSLDKMEGFPIDRWVKRALVDWYGHEEKARYGDLLSWAQERWGSRAGYVQQYLFHHRRLMG
jgi:N-glycosylase/DNA lyase